MSLCTCLYRQFTAIPLLEYVKLYGLAAVRDASITVCSLTSSLACLVSGALSMLNYQQIYLFG